MLNMEKKWRSWIYFLLTDFIGRMKRDVSDAFHDIFYALKKQNIFLKAKLQASFLAFAKKPYPSPVQISVTPIRTHHVKTHMRIEITRDACCAQDDQIGQLDMAFEVAPDAPLRDLVTIVIDAGFLQYSSSHVTMLGVAGKTEIVRISSSYYTKREPEYLLSPDLSISEVLKNGQIHFQF